MVDNRSYEIVLDRYLKYQNPTPIFTQYDTDTAELRFRFIKNGAEYDIPYTRLILIITKPDKTQVYQEIYDFNGNTASVILKNQALTVPGHVMCQIEMYDTLRLESTCQFMIEVRQSLNDGKGIVSSNEYQVLQQLFIDVDEKMQEMDQSITENIVKNNTAVQKNINDNNASIKQNIDAMKSATDAAIKSIDGSSLGQLNNQVLEAKYQTFIADRLMSKVGENKVITKSNLPSTLELTDEDYDQLELLNTPATLEEPMIVEEVDAPSTLEEPMEEEFEDHPTTLEEPMLEDSDVTPIESGFAKSAILNGNTLVNLLKLNENITFKENQTIVAGWRVQKNWQNGWCGWFQKDISMYKPNTTYGVFIWVKENGFTGRWSPHIASKESVFGTSSITYFESGQTGFMFRKITTKQEFTNETVGLRPSTDESGMKDQIIKYRIIVVEYQDGMENWDIPYFEGMCSVKMPVLTMTGKNLFNPKAKFTYYAVKGLTLNVVGDTFEIRGTPTEDYAHFSSENKIKKGTYTVNIYDKGVFSGDKTKIWCYNEKGSLVANVSNGTSFTVNEDVYKIAIVVQILKVGNPVDFKLTVQLESGDKTSYEPYKSNILSTPSDLVLGGVDNIKDTVDLTNGEVVENTKEFRLSTLTSSDYIITQINEKTILFQMTTSGKNKLLAKKSGVCVCNKIPISPGSDDVFHARLDGSDPNSSFSIWMDKIKIETQDVNGLIKWFIDNDVTVRYQLATPTIKTVDLINKPFFFKDGHILLSSGSADKSLLPILEYTVPTNLRGQSDNNAESLLALDNEKVDIKSVDKDATPNSVTKRDGAGDITVATAVIFKDRGSMGIDKDKGSPVFKDITNTKYDVWNAKNVPIEEGSFTPIARGSSTGTMTSSNAVGQYVRIGKIVNFHLEINIIGIGGAQGNLMISGLPFVGASGAGKSLSIGIIGGMPTGNIFTPFMSGGSSNITIQQKNISTGAIGWLTAAGATSNPPDSNGNRIAISGTYTIN